MYIFIYVHIQACLSGRSHVLQGAEDLVHSQILTAAEECGYFLGAAMGSPKLDFPRQRLGSANLPPAHPASDCAQKGMSISAVLS